jgi:anaerobic magnesium-protoporphyrin IX monomethyl ester cyclase
MKIALYFPPLVIPAIISPYPSLPLLAGYIKDNSRHEVFCKDLNVDIVNKLVVLGGGERALEELLNDSGSGVSVNRLKMSMEKVEQYTLKGLHKLYPSIFIDQNTYYKLQGNDSKFSYPHYLVDYWNLTYEQLNRIIDDKESEPIINELGENYFSHIKGTETIIVGISVAFFTQFGPAISLARHIKGINPNIIIIIGGAVIRHISQKLNKISRIFEVIDCFVETEGEVFLTNFADAVEQNKPWTDVPGAIWRNETGDIINNSTRPFSINENCNYDYSLIHNHDYLEPLFLHIRTSIGCYWDKCKFCIQSFNRYQAKSIESIVSEMLRLKRDYQVKSITFTDEAVPLPKLLELADLLIRKNVSIPWESASRFDYELTEPMAEKLFKAGCRVINFGLESGCQRVNNLMNKGVNVKLAHKIIEICAKNGIHCVITSMIGFPGEREDEMLETVAFLKDISGNKVSAFLSIFSLSFGSYVFNHPEEFDISHIEVPEEYFFKEHHSFQRKEQIPYQRLMEIRELFYQDV